MERGIITITENGAVAMPTAPVWMTQQEMSDETKRYIKQDNGINYDVYSLEMVIAVSFKLRGRESMAFRRFIMGRLTMNNRQPVNLFFSLSPSRGKRAGN